MKEIIVRFDEAEGGLSRGEVSGTVQVVGTARPSLAFCGWLQLLSHLEMLSGAAGEAAHGTTDQRL